MPIWLKRLAERVVIAAASCIEPIMSARRVEFRNGTNAIAFVAIKKIAGERRTPESVRFLGRKVYAGLIVVLISAMLHGLKPERVRSIREVLNISPSTLKRWRQWWLDNFVHSSFWKAMRARFMPRVVRRDAALVIVDEV